MKDSFILFKNIISILSKYFFRLVTQTFNKLIQNMSSDRPNL